MWLFIVFWSWGYGGKVTIYLRNDKGNGEKFFLREVGEEMLNGWYKEVAIVAMLQLLQLLQCCNKVYSTR